MNICVLGAGAWGTAFALHLERLGHTTTLVPRRFDHALQLASERVNKDYLPGYPMPNTLQVAHELRPALMEAETVLLACPSQAFREWARTIAVNLDLARELRFVISLSKGLEGGSHLRLSQVLAAELPDLLHGSLSGPTYATEVAAGKPTAMVLASDRPDPVVAAVQEALSGPTLRVYTSSDLAGVEFGGALKNIYAIAAGCSDGLCLGDNARAALLTRALAEMVRLGQLLGARAETFYGLSGFGDLVATCTGAWSRNRDFGFQIGQGSAPAALLTGRRTVVEGYRTAEAFSELCRERNLEAPILQEVFAILYRAKQPAEALASLMARALKSE